MQRSSRLRDDGGVFGTSPPWRRVREQLVAAWESVCRTLQQGNVAAWGAMWAVVAAIAAATLMGRSDAVAFLASAAVAALLRAAQTEETPRLLPLAASCCVAIVLAPTLPLLACWLVTLAMGDRFAVVQSPSLIAGQTADEQATLATREEAVDAITFDATQHRTVTEDGVHVAGEVCVRPGTSRRVVHVVFEQALSSVPQVEVEPLEGELIARVDDATPFGLRIAIQGAGDGGVIGYAAFCATEKSLPKSDERRAA